MRTITLFCILFCTVAICHTALAQQNKLSKQLVFKQLITDGDRLAKLDSFNRAMDKYNAAMVALPDSLPVVQNRIKRVFEKIENLKKVADRQRKLAQGALNQVKEEQTRSEKRMNNALELLRNSIKDQKIENNTQLFKYYKQKGDSVFAVGEYTDALNAYAAARMLPDGEKNSALATKKGIAEYYKNVVDSADHLLRSGNYRMAEKYCNELIEANPQGRKNRLYAAAINPLNATIFVKGGTFLMGDSLSEGSDEKPVHAVTLSSFEISAYEVTNLQYAVFLNRAGVESDGSYNGNTLIYTHSWGVQWNGKTQRWEAARGYEHHPVINVTWYGADEYCKFYGGSLPTEAQWEYAARGGVFSDRCMDSDSIFRLKLSSGSVNQSKNHPNLRIPNRHDYIYAGSDSIDDIAWYSVTSKNTSTFPVGLKQPNELGICDLSGNVWEWCADWYDENFYLKCKNIGMTKNIVNDAKNSYRVLRGGSWSNGAGGSRAAYRFGNTPDSNWYNGGFRVVFGF
jgi:formylglycine-generating enzyme required for sulfatase activity